MRQANWIDQRSDNRAVASKTDGYLGMLLTQVSGHAGEDGA